MLKHTTIFLALLGCADLFAQSLCMGYISDDFSGPNGSVPNPQLWALDHDCSQTAVSTVVSNGVLRQSSCYLNNCAMGCVGTDIYSLFHFCDFDMSIQFVGTTGGKHANFGVAALQSLPPSSTCVAPPTPIVCIFRLVPPNLTVQVMPTYANVSTPVDANGHPYHAVPGDFLRIHGVRGQFVRFYLNDTLIYQQLNWDLGVDTLGVEIASQSEMTSGMCQTTEWDHFSLTFTSPNRISSITPSEGGSIGGDIVTINGAGLQSLSAVSFGGSAGAILSTSPTQAQVLTPSGPRCRLTDAGVDICLATSSGTCCVPGAWNWLPRLSVDATWQPNSNVLLTLKGDAASSFLLFASSSPAQCDGVAVPPSIDHFLLVGSPLCIATLPAPAGIVFFGGVLPASWPAGLSVTMQAANMPAQGTAFQLTNADS